MDKDLNDFLARIDAFPLKARVELLQMVSGDRPVAQITVLQRFRSRMLPAILQLRRMGFASTQKLGEKGVLEFYVSKSVELSKEAAVCNDSQRFGELMGFPASAIKAFMQGQDHMLSNKEVEDLIGFPDYFFWLRFSRDCPQDAVEYLRRSYKLLVELGEPLLDALISNIDIREPVEFKGKIRKFVYAR